MKSYIFLQTLLIGLIIPDFSFAADGRGIPSQALGRSFRTMARGINYWLLIIRGRRGALPAPSDPSPPSGGDGEWPDLEDVLANPSAEAPRSEDLEGGVISQSSPLGLPAGVEPDWTASWAPPPPPPRPTLPELMEMPLEGLWARAPWRGYPATLEEVELSIRIMEAILQQPHKKLGQSEFKISAEFVPLLRRLREAALRPPAEPAAGLSRTESTEALPEEPEV